MTSTSNSPSSPPSEGAAAPLGSKSAGPSPPVPLARVCVIYAFPSASEGHGPRILETLKKTLEETGAPYTLLDLYRQKFQPVMSEEEVAAYGKVLPPDVAAAQAVLRDSDVWVLVFPVWWSTPPAILKGFLDRALTPGFGFKYGAKGVVQGLLTHKRALIIRTFGSSATQEEKLGEVAVNFMEKAVLGFCGVQATSVDFYSINSLAPTAFEHALNTQVAGGMRRMLVKPTAVPHNLRTVSAPYLPPIERRSEMTPLTADEEEKPELSDQAKSDLEYFKSASRATKQAVREGRAANINQILDQAERGEIPRYGSSRGSNQNQNRNQSQNRGGRNDTRGGSYSGNRRPGDSRGGSFGPRENVQNMGGYGAGRSSGGSYGGNRPQGGGPGSRSQGDSRQNFGGSRSSGRPPQGGHFGGSEAGNRPSQGGFGGSRTPGDSRPGGNSAQGGTHKQRHDFRHHGKRREHGSGRR